MLKEKNENGSLAVSVIILIVLILVSTALVARVTASAVATRKGQSIAAALSAADAGVARAVFEIDQGGATSFQGSGTVNGATYLYKGTYVNRNTWEVKAKGTDATQSRAIKVTVRRSTEFPYAIFSEQTLRFNGNGWSNITSYSSETGATNTGNAVVGSNHAIIINGGGGGDQQNYYTPSGSCSGCGNGVQQEGPYDLSDPIIPTAEIQACPVGGVFPTLINGGGGSPYVCDRDISFASGNVAVTNGPVKIYVTPNHQVSMSDVSINPGGQAKNFILYKLGTGALNVGVGSHAPSIVGVLYAPDTNMTIDGGQLSFDGSLTINSLTIQGNPNLSVRYDVSVQSILSQEWQQVDWHEIGSNDY